LLFIHQLIISAEKNGGAGFDDIKDRQATEDVSQKLDKDFDLRLKHAGSRQNLLLTGNKADTVAVEEKSLAQKISKHHEGGPEQEVQEVLGSGRKLLFISTGDHQPHSKPSDQQDQN